MVTQCLKLIMLYLLFPPIVSAYLQVVTKSVVFDNIVVAAVLSELLPEVLSPLSHHLHTIPCVTVGVVCLEFKGRVLPPEYEEVTLYTHVRHYA